MTDGGLEDAAASGNRTPLRRIGDNAVNRECQRSGGGGA